MRWPFTFRKRRQMADPGLEEARRARVAAQQHLATTTSEVVIPLREMHRENHIQPLINHLIQKRAERGSASG